MNNVYNNIQDIVGDTPLLKLNRYGEKHNFSSSVYAKLECLNPAGSIKDRAALSMIQDAQAKGLLTKDSVIVEPTSGNTGIGLAAMAVSQGYRVVLTMPETMSQERRTMLAAYGAELVLTSGKLGMQGAVDKANELVAADPNAIMLGQFDNQANADAHYRTTGPELWKALDGKIDVFVCGVGTGGTISGTGAYLKEKNPAIEVVAVEPADSPLLSTGNAGPHKLQGLGANFIPTLLNQKIYDKIITATTEEAFQAGADIARTEGTFVGISSGAALSAVKKLATDPAYAGKNIVVILPDSGDRYLSSPMVTGE